MFKYEEEKKKKEILWNKYTKYIDGCANMTNASYSFLDTHKYYPTNHHLCETM